MVRQGSFQRFQTERCTPGGAAARRRARGEAGPPPRLASPEESARIKRRSLSSTASPSLQPQCATTSSRARDTLSIVLMSVMKRTLTCPEPQSCVDRALRNPNHVDRRQVSLDSHLERDVSGKRKSTKHASPKVDQPNDPPNDDQPLTPARLQALLPDFTGARRCCRAAGGILRHATRKLLPCIVFLAVFFCLFGIAVIGSTARVTTNPIKAGLRPSSPAGRIPPSPALSPPSPPVKEQKPGSSLFMDPQLELVTQERDVDNEMVDFDQKGKRVRHKRFVPYNHPPDQQEEATKHSGKGAGKDAKGWSVGNELRDADFARTKSPKEANLPLGVRRAGAATRGVNRSRTLPIQKPLKSAPRQRKGPQIEPDANLDVRALRKRYAHRKFLFPLLDQGPNNQYLQFRVALARARALNRTIVLPLWLPHNPKFQHFHPGAPHVPSRDKKLDQISYPFDSTFDPVAISKYVRTLDLKTFITLSGGKLELCLGHEDGDKFESYLRHSGVNCSSYTTNMDLVHSDMRFLGFHQYDKDVGTRDKFYEYLKWSPRVVEVVNWISGLLFNGSSYVASHIRVADAHWEHSDCKHTISGVPVPSVSCGDGINVINYSSIAQEIWYTMQRTGYTETIFVATNMNCSDQRIVRIARMLYQRSVRLVCPKQLLQERLGDDNYMISLIEQEMCARANAFIGSKYSTWTDTVKGLRAYRHGDSASGPENFLFEELYAVGVR